MSAPLSSGYNTEMSYTLGFYPEMAPSFMNFACLLNGYEGIKFESGPRYCELGCGRGFGIILLAAANPDMEFVGIDFMPEQIAEARKLAALAQITNVHFYDMSFEDALRSDDPKLGDFSIITLHGIYSWVRQDIRQQVLQFLGNRLAAGGLVYVSYNTMPGWGAIQPIQRLMMELRQRSNNDSVSVIRQGMSLLKNLADHNSAYIVQNPAAKMRLQGMMQQDVSYLTHEYLNEGWEALYVTDVMANFAAAKLDYVGSATLSDNTLNLCVPQNLQPAVCAAPDVAMHELLKDYVINKQFRRDLYMKQPRKLSEQEVLARMAELRFAQIHLPKQTPEKFKIPIGDISLKPGLVDCVLGTFKGQVASGAEIFADGEKKGFMSAQLILALQLLTQAAVLSPARSGLDPASSQRLNKVVISISGVDDTHQYLASPVTGSALKSSFIERVVAAGAVNPGSDENVARATLTKLEAAGSGFYRRDKKLESNEEGIGEVAEFVAAFRERQIPLWRSLGMIA